MLSMASDRRRRRRALQRNVVAVMATLLAGSAFASGCGNPATEPPGRTTSTERSTQSTPGTSTTPAADRRATAVCGRYGKAAGQVESLLSTPDNVHPGVFGTTLVQWADEIDTIAADAPRGLRTKMATAAEALRWIERTLRRQQVEPAGIAQAVEEWRAASQDAVIACEAYG
jgi:hypothetical protein